jgi:serine/threonine protein kinase
MASGPEEAAALDAAVVEILPGEDSMKPEPTAPRRIGRYELCLELASGGMATVYLARVHGASGFEKLVALKRIHPHLAKEKQYVDMFLDEAQIASRITHPNVCSVFDFGQAGGEYYIAMEYLVGEPLSRLCRRVGQMKQQRRHPLLPLRMAGIIAHACEGLHAAHELRDANGQLLHVVHRDASPRNLFVTYDGSVQVVDFGVASARHRTHHTATGQVKGTFAYMAPEQLRASTIDRRVDVWALGVALWEMLTFRRLFRRDNTANTVHAILYDEVVPPSSHRPQIPGDLDEIVLKALQREPRDRWQTAREMGRALQQVIRSRHEIIGPAELSDWMAEVFPQGQAQKDQLVEIARMVREPIPTRSRLSDSATSGANVQLSDASFIRPRTKSIKSSKSSKRPRALAWLLGALALVGVVALAAIGLQPTGGRPQAMSAAPVEVAVGSVEEPIEPNVESIEKHSESIDESSSREEQANDGDEAVEEADDMAEPTTPKAAPIADRRHRSRRLTETGPGTINLVTRGGWAEVYEGDKLLGSTPRRLKLPAGRHRLVLKPFGEGKPKTIVVRVVAHKTKNVSIRLD